MHDKPGTVKFDVTSPTFDADVDAALDEGYVPIGAPGNFLVLAKGYKTPQEQ